MLKKKIIIILSSKSIHNLPVRSPWFVRPFPRFDRACKVYRCEFQAEVHHAAQWQTAHVHDTAPLYGAPRATEPNGKTVHMVAGRSEHVCGLVAMPSRSYHAAELTSEIEKLCAILRFCQSFFRYQTSHGMSAWFCGCKFQTNPGNFLWFFTIFSPLLWLSLLSTAPISI